MKRLVFILSFTLFLNASETATDSLSLAQAIYVLKSENLEIKSAIIDVDIAQEDITAVQGMNWGKLDFTQDVANSNDAGNVFGFKLSSREATFGDFGFSEFSTTNPSILSVQPNDLNYPKNRTFFQTKLRYEIPLFTGFAISNYTDIMSQVKKIRSLEKAQIINKKIYELRKSYYDLALLKGSIKNLSVILQNINALEEMTKSMIDVGYAKHVDLLEVQAKKGNVQRLLLQMNSNEKLLYHYVSFLLNKKISSIQTPQTQIETSSLSDGQILNRNLDVQKASTALMLKTSALHLSKAAFYPTIGAFGEISTADDSFLGSAIEHRAYAIGARLSWNLFNGGIDKSKLEKSRLEHLKTQSQVKLVQSAIFLQLAKTRTEIQSSNEEIASLQKELELADSIYKNYVGRYKEKLSSMSDVIVKQSAQIQKILQLQIAKNRRNEKIFALEKLANGEQ